jgi:hypothetical protein
MSGEVIYSVFVSSTYEDLREERAEVQTALLKLHCMPISMELFGSADEETWDFIKRQIDGCDYYVVVIADKYGSTAEDGVSYTQREYDYARELKKPVLSFVHGDRKSLRRDKTEDDPIKRSKLEAFIEKVRRYPVSLFISPHDLATQVTVSFVNLRDRRPATGFIRADQVPDLKKYADLLEENARLREEIVRTRELAIIPFPASETVKLETFYYYEDGSRIDSREQWVISVSWKDLFILFVEKILTERDWRYKISPIIGDLLYSEIRNKYGEDRDYTVDAQIRTSGIDQILLQFIGWHLFEGFVESPQLTEYGQKQYGLLRRSS